jgi:purine-binding chemotaxis protein CheW
MMSGKSFNVSENKTQYLTFELADELYAIDILKVREIRGWEPVRKIPNTPAFIKGALNLRTTVVPIVDLRLRFDLSPQQYTPTTVVIILSVGEDDGNSLGIVVDSVSDVVEIPHHKIEQKPDFGSKIDIRYMQGLYIDDDKIFLLLNSDKLLAPEELSLVESIPQSSNDRENG